MALDDRIVIRRQMKARHDQVFSAFSDRAALVQWFKPKPDMAVDAIEFEFNTRGGLHLEFDEGGAEKLSLRGKFVRICPHSDIAFTWVWDAPHPDAGIMTLVEISIEGRGELTDLTITHSKLPTQETRARHVEGWIGCLTQLDSFVELVTT